MNQTRKRVLSLLMVLTMLIGMMTAVTVGATEAVEWKLIKELDFEEETDYSVGIYSSCDSECISVEGSKVLHVTTPNQYGQLRFNVQNIAFENGATYKISYRAKANRNDMIHNLLFGSLYFETKNDIIETGWATFEKTLEYTIESATNAIIFLVSNANSDDELWVDDIKIYKQVILKAPVVDSVFIEGVTQIGQTLTANAVVSDENEDDTATASYQWQVKIGDDWKDISGETSDSYLIQENETVNGEQVAILGKQVRVVVTPNSNNQPSPGTPVSSEPTQAIIEATLPPSGHTPEIKGGTYEVGQTLEASFTYVPSEDKISQGNSQYIWETSFDNESFTSVQSGTSNQYTIGLGDVGKWLRVRIIPKDKNGLRAEEELIVDATKVEGEVAFYVSTKGNDENKGSQEKPFKTIQKARDTIRELKGNLPNGGITVNIMGGTYPISEPINFTEEDSGTEKSPIVYQAYNNETVTFSGGKLLDSTKIEKVTDEKVLDGLVEEDAKKHLYMLDLGKQGVEMDALQPYGNGFSRDRTGYAPKRIYMNNQLLTEARWPNDDQSQNLVECIPLTAADGIDETKYNAPKTPIVFQYPDSENRSAKWDVKEGDAYVGGAVVYYWAQTFLRIKEIDAEKKIVTSLDNSVYGSVLDVGWAPQFKVFFSNIFAEIDKPGESYVDRENGILYFYPIGSVENAEMVVATLKENMISLNEVSYVSFKGIGFKNTVETAIDMYDCDHVTIGDAEISNITQSGVDMTNCTNTVIEGCNFYNIGARAIYIIGDDAVLKVHSSQQNTTIPENRKNLTSSGNEIRYNNFHYVNIFPDNKDAAIYMEYAVGEWIHHNEFNDIDIYTIRIMNSNDILIEYNKMLNLGELNSDAGAVNWGREIDSLGHTVRYNYFENIGSKLVSNHLVGHQSVSIFTDGASTGGNIYGNVFLNGGSNQLGVGSATVGNGPEFSNVWGNISICTDFDRMTRSFMMRNWGHIEGLDNLYGVRVPEGIAASSWLYHMGMREPYGGVSSDKMQQSDKDMMWSNEWAEHYAGSQWEGALEHYCKENYEGAKALFDQEDYAGVLEFLDENLIHERTSKIHDNVSIGATTMDSKADHYQNYNGTQHAITEEDKALFVDFDNKDFTLTPEGLAKIQEKAPEFEAISFNEIGLGNRVVGGHKPVVTINPELYTITEDGTNISPSYTFTDEDGDLEANSKIYWHVSDSADGKYEQIYGVEGKKFEVTEEYTGRYLKYEVVPFDTASLRGEPVLSDSISVNSVTVTADVGENGKLMKNEAQVTEPEIVVTPGACTYQAIPDSGYRVGTVTVTSGGVTTPVSVNGKNEFNVPISSDTSITVTFVEITETELGFVNSDGEEKAGWSNGDEIQADSFYYNNQEKTVNTKIYLGLYQGNMLMALVGSEPMEVKPGKGVHLATDSLVIPKTGDYQVKQFVWDANTCCPLFAPLELKKEMTQNK